MKAKPKSVKNKLFGMVCGEVLPVDRGSVSQIANLDQLCSDHPWSLDRWRTQLLKSGVECHAVDHNGRIIAFAVIHVGQSRVRVTDILVHGDHRRTGVGRMLLDYLEVIHLNEIRDTLEFVIDERDISTQKFLKSCGIRSAEVIRGEPYGHYLIKRGYNAPY